MFIYFSPVWKYCIVTQERINSGFCTEHGVIGHLGARWEMRQKLHLGFFVCNGFSFIGMVTGDWHKGRGAFWKTKDSSHPPWKKMKRLRRGMREFLFVCPGENLRSLFSSFHLAIPSSHCIIPPPTLLSFLITLSHEAPLPPPPEETSPWPVTVEDLHVR